MIVKVQNILGHFPLGGHGFGASLREAATVAETAALEDVGLLLSGDIEQDFWQF